MIEEQLILDLPNNLLSIGNIIHSWKTSNKVNKLLHYIQCDIRYNYKIIDGPHEHIDKESHYEYTARLLSKTIRIFGINIYTIIYDN